MIFTISSFSAANARHPPSLVFSVFKVDEFNRIDSFDFLIGLILMIFLLD